MSRNSKIQKNILIVALKVINCILLLNISIFAITDTIYYVGSSTVGQFIKSAKKEYTKVHFKLNTVPESEGGENTIAFGKADLGGVAREVKPEFIAMGIKKYLIGKDAIGIWLHKDNPVSKLSSSQLKAIYTDSVSNWKYVSGSDNKINAYTVKHFSATKVVFRNKILGNRGYGRHVITIKPDEKIIDTIASDKYGIGMLSLSLGINHPNYVNTKLIVVDSQKPIVSNPNYPITRNLYLITKGEPKGKVKDFIEWALSENGQKIVMQYFVGITK